jgi:hypothetical protein
MNRTSGSGGCASSLRKSITSGSIAKWQELSSIPAGDLHCLQSLKARFVVYMFTSAYPCFCRNCDLSRISAPELRTIPATFGTIPCNLVSCKAVFIHVWLLTIPVQAIAFRQLCFAWIVSDISLQIGKLFWAANDVIKRIWLPKRAFACQIFIDPACGISHPRLAYYTQIVTCPKLPEDVNVVGHDDETIQVVPITVKVTNILRDDSCNFLVPQNAFAITFIKRPMNDSIAKSLYTFAYLSLPQLQSFFESWCRN